MKTLGHRWFNIGAALLTGIYAVGAGAAPRTLYYAFPRVGGLAYQFQSIGADSDYTWTLYAYDEGGLGYFTNAVVRHNDPGGATLEHQDINNLDFNEASVRSRPGCVLLHTYLSTLFPPFPAQRHGQIFQSCFGGGSWPSFKRTNIPGAGVEDVAPDQSWVWVSSSLSGSTVKHYMPKGEEGGVLKFEVDSGTPLYTFPDKVTNLSSDGNCFIGWLHGTDEVIQSCKDDGTHWWKTWRKIPGLWAKDTPGRDVTAIASDDRNTWLAVRITNTSTTQLVHLDFNGNPTEAPYEMSKSNSFVILEISKAGKCAVAAASTHGGLSIDKFFRICNGVGGGWREFKPEKAPPKLSARPVKFDGSLSSSTMATDIHEPAR